MTRPLAILCALVLAAPTAIATAHAEEDCGDLGRNYQLIEREAVSVQTNMALISAADRGCKALARRSSPPELRWRRATGLAPCRWRTRRAGPTAG